jgi:hypothetical protein
MAIDTKDKKVGGIHSLRADRHARQPEFYCENCKCKRYVPCGCKKASNREERSKVVQDGALT